MMKVSSIQHPAQNLTKRPDTIENDRKDPSPRAVSPPQHAGKIKSNTLWRAWKCAVRVLAVSAAAGAEAAQHDGLRRRQEDEKASSERGSASGNATMPEPPSTGLFDGSFVHEFRFNLTAEARAALLENGKRDAQLAQSFQPSENRYVAGELHVDGEDVGAVKLRYKGNYGTLGGCFTRDTLEQKCPKLSMRVKAGAGSSLPGGLEEVNLHAMMFQESLMNERLGFHAFRAAGVLAPRSVHAFVYVNDEPKGLFALTENPNKDFVKTRFGNNDGLLYKEVWPSSQDTWPYQQALETHKKDDPPPTHDVMLRLAEGLAHQDEAERRAVIDRIVGLEALLRYRVADQLMANWDGVSRLYCTNQPPPDRTCNKNHNFIWYTDPQGHARLGAWDLDFTFDAARDPADWGPKSPASCDPSTAEHFVSAGCDRLLGTVIDEDRSAFAQVARPLLSGPLNASRLTAEVDRYAAQIASAVEKDPFVDTGRWQRALEKLRGDIVILSERMERSLD